MPEDPITDHDFNTHGRLLSNGRYATLLTAAGGGFSSFGDLALTRSAGDVTRDADGFFIYIRDLESREVWSAGYQPTCRTPDRYAVRAESTTAAILRQDAGIATQMTVYVVPAHDVEVRRITLTNHSDKPRRLELTSYAEAVLNTRTADTAHPAFSKLFVQTERIPGQPVLLAHRRPSSPDDPPLWLMHALLEAGTEVEVETDRARFVGRGKTLEAPRALSGSAPLSGTVGNVLDPIVSLRGVVDLAPGEITERTFVLGAARHRDAALELIEKMRTVEVPAATALFAEITLPDSANIAYLPATGGDAFLKPWDADEVLRLDNSYGGFNESGDEYVIRIIPANDDLGLPPLPWANVIANEQAGFLATESGGGYTWRGNSREHNLTPWLNDPITDATGEAIYLRDEQAGVFWSPTPLPVPQEAAYEVRHGFGYTRYRHISHDLDQEVTQFVPRHDPVKIIRLRFTNQSTEARKLSVFRYQRWILGALPAENHRHVITAYDANLQAVLARNPDATDYEQAVAFAAVAGARIVSFTADREAFLGKYGTLANPAALTGNAPLNGRSGADMDPCAAFHLNLDLAPGETITCAFLLGEGADQEEARGLLHKYQSLKNVDVALAEVQSFWKNRVTTVQIETPAPELDLMVNGWLLYQNLSCRMWGRSAFYQSGGAFGFRDQLQDASALVYAHPDLTRAQLLLHAAHQFVEGDVLHWWHPPASRGIRTRFSDDLLWLPYLAAFYIKTTGDHALLDESVRFLQADQLEDGEDEVFLEPQDSGEYGSFYEHCCRSLDRSLTAGAHGLPLMGTGDWNDGMNRVGRQGRGESVWLGFFLYSILHDFIPICEARGDQARVERYSTYRQHLARALNDTGWDGNWYRRAYYDNGAPLGAAQNDECQIDALAQAWSVISEAAPADRAEQALDAMVEHLVSEEDGLIRLLTPAFDKTPHDPGYIKGYVPGVRENGGQYTHAALWAVKALAEAGRGNQATRLMQMLSPVSHTRTPEEVAVYQVEPYVIAADVYGVAPHVGRGGWTWYTGSAGWMYRVVLESILGLHLEGGDTLVIRPHIADGWPGYRLRYRLPACGTIYKIEVHNPDGDAEGVVAVAFDGEPVDAVAAAARLPVVRDGAVHQVKVILGMVASVAQAG